MKLKILTGALTGALKVYIVELLVNEFGSAGWNITKEFQPVDRPFSVVEDFVIHRSCCLERSVKRLGTQEDALLISLAKHENNVQAMFHVTSELEKLMGDTKRAFYAVKLGKGLFPFMLFDDLVRSLRARFQQEKKEKLENS